MSANFSCASLAELRNTNVDELIRYNDESFDDNVIGEICDLIEGKQEAKNEWGFLVEGWKQKDEQDPDLLAKMKGLFVYIAISMSLLGLLSNGSDGREISTNATIYAAPYVPYNNHAGGSVSIPNVLESMEINAMQMVTTGLTASYGAIAVFKEHDDSQTGDGWQGVQKK